VTGVIVAFAASFTLGVALGVVSATCARGSLRPCRRLREHWNLVIWTGGLLALASAATIAIAASHVEYQRAFLAATCGAIVLIVGAASWLLLVETDDGDAWATDDEPEWWPTFERELEEWSRHTRVLSR
jgi:hypothetical protein